jgi:endonuclease/exonuclease/phosphatase family metal-dependent hydrolase
VLLAAGLSIVFSFSPTRSHSANSAADPVSSDFDCASQLLETGHPQKRRAATQPGSKIKIVSYNIRWRSGDDLHRLAQLLKNGAELGGAAIIGLQEVDRDKKRTGNTNTVRILAEELGMYYAWTAQPPAKTDQEEETGVAILSAYPLSDVRRLVLPHKGPAGRRRVALGATISVGKTDVRFYSVHSENRIPIPCKLQQLKAVITDLDRYRKDMPVVVLGDLNTWEPAAVAQTFKLFGAENFHTPFDDRPTFYRLALFIPIDLKLDWIWLRNLEATGNGIDRGVKLSDHFPLWVDLRSPAGLIDSTLTNQ